MDGPENTEKGTTGDFSRCKQIHKEINYALKNDCESGQEIRYETALLVSDSEPGLWHLYYSEEGEAPVWLDLMNLDAFHGTGHIYRILQHVVQWGKSKDADEEGPPLTEFGRGFQ